MEKDCTIYDSENCPKGLTFENILMKESLDLLFVGCWGVYCKDGEQEVIKYKKSEFKIDKGLFGGKSVAEGMSEYSHKNNVDAVILAGDNIYSRNPTKEEMANPYPELKDDLNDMDLQFSEGFLKCMNNVKTENFYLAIGNHDIHNCKILNKQLNFNQGGWNLPGLYYNVIYKLDNYKVNIIFIDTNLYDKKKTCNEDQYPEDDEKIQDSHRIWLEYTRNKQKLWIEQVIKTNNCKWNLIVGHIPFINNPHKKIKDSNFDYSMNNDLISDIYSIRQEINKMSLDIQLYMCADEHNQQFIKCPENVGIIPNLPPIIIAGSGGTDLDNFLPSHSLKTCTMIGKKAHGFVSLNIDSTNIQITYYESKDLKTIDYKTLTVNLNGNLV